MRLLAKDPPFLFILFIGLFSWTVTHIVNRALEKPIIEYEQSTPVNASDLIACKDENAIKSKVDTLTVTRFQVTNISQNSLFHDLTFLVVAKGGDIHGVRMRAVSPSVSGDTPEVCYRSHAEFSKVSIHPRASFMLDIGSDEKTRLSIHLKESSMPINLVSNNLETFMIKNEYYILLIFLLIAVIGIIWYLKVIIKLM